MTKKTKETEFKETLEDIKENIETKTDEIKKDLKKKSKTIKKDLTKKTEELKEELKEKTEEIVDKAEEILKDVKDSSKKYDKKDIEENKAMACLSYILAPIPYFLDNKSKWVRYHSIQGMNLLIIFLILSVLVSFVNAMFLSSSEFLSTILRTTLNVFGAIYSITGIIHVCNGEAKELPVINKLKLIKK